MLDHQGFANLPHGEPQAASAHLNLKGGSISDKFLVGHGPDCSSDFWFDFWALSHKHTLQLACLFVYNNRMVDVLTEEQRKYCMSRIRGKDTKPEMVVRRLTHSLGYRYRLHVRTLPGCPDLVFPSRKKVIFVHGCFWHRHNCRYGRVKPSTRKKFWQAKLERNKERHKRNRRKLQSKGWRILTIWECQTKKPEKMIDRIVDFLESK